MNKTDQVYVNTINAIQRNTNCYKLRTTIHDQFIDANFGMNDDGNYELQFGITKECEENGIDISYFFSNPFILIAPGQNIFVQNTDIVEASQSIMNVYPLSCTVVTKAFKGDVRLDDSLWHQSKQVAFIPLNFSKFDPSLLGVIYNLSFNKAKPYPGFGNGIRLFVEKNEIAFYYAKADDDQWYYVFRAIRPIDYEVFRKIIDTTMTAYALISGYYMADSIFFFSQKSEKIEDLTYRYENLKKTINTESPLVGGHFFNDIAESRYKLTGKQFNDLVALLYTHEECNRAAMLLFTANKESGCAKGALGAVALETISNVICRELAPKSIVNDKKIIRGIVHKLKQVIKSYRDGLTPDQIDALYKKIVVINTIPNTTKFLEAFNIVGIKLEEEEIYCLKNRNLFLHGSLPKRNQDVGLSESELIDLVSNRIVMLSAMLLLKKTGYTGFVVDKGFTDINRLRRIRAGLTRPHGVRLRDISNPDIIK